MEKKVNEALNVLLADYHIFYQKLRNFHWNVKGERFFVLHAKFEEMYNEVSEVIDEIAERILSRGFTPLSKMADYLKASRFEEAETNLDGLEMVKTLLTDLKSLIANQRKLVEEASEIDDVATANLLEEFADGQEKTVWMLNAFLSK